MKCQGNVNFGPGSCPSLAGVSAALCRGGDGVQLRTREEVVIRWEFRRSLR